MGMTKTHVTRRAYWYQWRRDVKIYVKRCPKCNTYHKGTTPPRQGNLVPLLTGAPVEGWACDLAGPFQKSTKGHVYILTAICVFSKYIILVPLRDKKAIPLANAIYEKVFLKYGAGEILTDNGGEFRNELLGELCRLMGIYRSFITAYHAKCNAFCEHSHATVNSMLAKCIETNQRDCTDHLQQVAFSFNASTQESTKYSLFFLMHGTKPRWNIDLQMREYERVAYSVNDFADLLIKRMETAHELVRQHLGTTVNKMSEWYDKKVHTQSFIPGDQFFVLNLRQYKGRCPKWMRRYSHVVTVKKKINDVTNQLYCAEWRQRYWLIHVDMLKLCTAATQSPDSVATQTTTHYLRLWQRGVRQPGKRISMGMDRRKSWKARQF